MPVAFTGEKTLFTGIYRQIWFTTTEFLQNTSPNIHMSNFKNISII